MSPIHSTRSKTGASLPKMSEENSTKEKKAPTKSKSSKSKKSSKASNAAKSSVALPSQAGGGDVLFVSRALDKASVAEEAPVEDNLEQKESEGGDESVDADAAGGGVLRSLVRGASKAMGRRAVSVDAGGGDSSADAGPTAKSAEGGVAAGRSRGKRTRGKKGDRTGGKQGAKGASGSGGGPRASRAEGRERNEAVEQVSVLVGQEEGGDPVEQALAAQKRIMGDEEKKNAFTSEVHDNFDPSLDPNQVERLGSIQGAVHMVRLTDHWEKSGIDRQAIIEAAAKKLLGFTRNDQVKKVLGEMGAAPIKQVYPLEVMLHILEEHPEFLPKVRRGEVLQNKANLVKGERILPGHEFRVKYPAEYKIKSFALVGGGQPGYEFRPFKNGIYHMIVDTPGTWNFALSAYLKGETVIDTFSVHVPDPGVVEPAPQ